MRDRIKYPRLACVGRTYRDAPEIDGLVLIPGELPLGELVPVRIDGAMTYDLTGQPVFDAGSAAVPLGLTLAGAPLIR